MNEFDRLVKWIDGQEMSLFDLYEHEPRYYRAVMREVNEMEEAYHAQDEDKLKHHMKRAQGFFLRGQRAVKEGKALKQEGTG